MDPMTEHPFLFGAQYYRAPTPEPECWETDLRRMRELGFNAVKFWAQWRWSHREPESFQFDDLDRLMDLAASNGLAVTLNTVLDIAPAWLYERWPDARQMSAAGQVVEPYAVGHRQIGGHPGPCYRHPGALAARREFMQAVYEHFRGHPALSMWDVWNEPEQSFQARHPDMRTLVCYCGHCRAGFRAWLEAKYGSLDRLNAVWGRCYTGWEQVEMPREPSTLGDFVDWREFHLDTMTAEAAWRLDMARALDPGRAAYLHVVPNTMTVFSSVTCVDDFALAEHCDVFAATMNGSPDFTIQVLSAARGKRCYNVESHVNFGSIRTHQRRLGLEDLLRDLLPQVGLGVRGFLFWQYRPEVLGAEAPAWGLVGLDGGDRPVTAAARSFWQTLRPHAQALLACPPAPAGIGVWKSRRNEVFHFCVDGALAPLAEDVGAYVDALYGQSYPFRFVSESMLEGGEMDGLKLLIMPSPLYMAEGEASALDRWVRTGGVLLAEAHLAAYNATTNRYSRRVPGCGLSEAWGIRETDSTAVQHLPATGPSAPQDRPMTDDERKAMATAGVVGGEFIPFVLDTGETVWGASRYAVLDPEGLSVLARFSDGSPALTARPVGRGTVLCCATHPGRGSRQDPSGLRALLARALSLAGVRSTLDATANEPGTVHVDLLSDAGGPRFVLVFNRTDAPQTLRLDLPGPLRGLFTGASWPQGTVSMTLPPRFVELYRVERDPEA